MRHLACAALLLTAILFSPRLFAQAASTPSATPSAATAPSIKFDVVYFKRCERIDLTHKQVSIPVGGDSLGEQCQPIRSLFDVAYGSNFPYLVKGEPAWVDTDAYDFQAKVAPEDIPTWQKMDLPARRLMTADLLADVLKLKMHVETQSRPVYNLVVAKGGPKLTASKPDPDAPDGTQKPSRSDVRWVGQDEAAYTNTNMKTLAGGLAARLDRDVVDKTGITGTYDFHVKPLPFIHYDPKTSNVETTDFAGIIDGVKSLGLKLDPGKSETTVIVVDHIERPPQN